MLFTFPSRYWFTIGRQGVLRLGGWSPHLRTGFHVSRSTQGSSAQLSIRGYHPLWPAFPCRSDRRTKVHWPDPLSLATTYGVSLDVLSSGYLDVSVRRVCLVTLWIQVTMTQWAGFPHSEIHGSTLAHSSPWLIAVCHALHRLSVPRHPPDALQRLIAEPSRTGASPVNATPRLHQHFGFHRTAAGRTSIAGQPNDPQPCGVRYATYSR